MKLKTTYSSKEDIPEGYAALFTEKDGAMVLTGVVGMKTQADIDTLQESLRKERADHKAAKTKLRAFGDMDPDEVHSKLDRIDELEAAATGKIDESKLEDMVASRIKTQTAPLERQVTNLTAERDEAREEAAGLSGKLIKRTVHDNIRTAATKAKLRPEAIEDALLIGERLFDVDDNTGQLVARDGVGITPGIDAEVWLTEVRETRPHWWPDSKSAGGRGGNGAGFGTNPFSADGWNMTMQGQMLRENPEKAAQMAKAAGTTVGGKRPEK